MNHDLATHLLAAERVYMEARERHEKERSEESKLFLAAAENELRLAELRAEMANRFPYFFCEKCEWQAVGERWYASAAPGEDVQEGGDGG